MDPNIKLVTEEIVKIRVEIKEGFDAQEASFTKRLDEASTAYQLHDTRVTNLEDTVVTFDKSFSEWRPEVDSSISVVKIELSKLNTYFVREAKVVGVATQGIPTNVSAPSSSTATDAPNGHSVESSHRDCGFGRVFTQIHDPVKGTMLPPPPPKFPLNVESPTHDSTKFAHPHHSDFTVHLGQLPKMHFPKFQGDNLKDRRGDQRGGEWEPIKIPQRNLAYIPEPTRDPSLRTRLRLISYGQAISLRKRTRIFTRNPDWCSCDHVRDRQHQSTVYLLSDISPNTWRACSRNYLRRPI
jgi:hypothetical protein